MKQLKRDYGYFEYSLPTESVETYVKRALVVLRKIKDQFPEFYDPFRSPSEVLTLSGARAFDTYYELGEGAIRGKIDSLKLLLKLHGIVLLEEDFPFGNESSPENRYSIVHLDALKDIPNRYRNMPVPGWNQPDFSLLKNDTDFFLWWENWQKGILLANDKDAVFKTWLATSSWMAHNLTFGMLLGYPGEAVCSILYETEADDDNGQIIWSNIDHADDFDGARVCYSYHKDLANHPSIVKHQALWSAILNGVYSSLEHDHLVK